MEEQNFRPGDCIRYLGRCHEEPKFAPAAEGSEGTVEEIVYGTEPGHGPGSFWTLSVRFDGPSGLRTLTVDAGRPFDRVEIIGKKHTVELPLSQLSLGETASGTLVAEASELRLPPGEWPALVVIEGNTFQRWQEMDHNGQFTGYEYRGLPAKLGGRYQLLRVYND